MSVQAKNDPKAVYGVLEIAQKFEEQKKEKEELPDLTFIIEPWQIEKDTMTGIYVEIAYGRYETGIVKIPDFMLEKKKMADMKRILIIRILSIF